jgi:hypothetical protein
VASHFTAARGTKNYAIPAALKKAKQSEDIGVRRIGQSKGSLTLVDTLVNRAVYQEIEPP